MTIEDSTETPSDKLEARQFSNQTTTPYEAIRLFDTERARCPVAHSDQYGGFFMMLGYDEVKRATSDFKSFSSAPQVIRPLDVRAPFPALEMDPPQHEQWRPLFEQAATPQVVSVLEPVIRTAVNRHIDDFVEAGEADIVAELTETLPAEAICHLVGIDDHLVIEVRDRAIEMFAAQGDPDEFPRKAAQFGELTIGQIRSRQVEPRDDYLTYLASVQVEDKPLDDDALFGVLAAGFLGAGHHSTTSAMSSLLFEVLSRPAVRDMVVSDPARMIPIAVEETLRLRPPFFGFYRRSRSDVEIGGTAIPAGADVYLGWASANRDPKVFDCPEDFRLDRGRNRHLTFGSGIHTCPGAPLARMELRVALEEILRRLPDIALDTTSPSYEFAGGNYAHIPSLRVRFSPGARELG